MYVCVRTCVYTCVRTCARVCACFSVHVWVCVCVRAHARVGDAKIQVANFEKYRERIYERVTATRKRQTSIHDFSKARLLKYIKYFVMFHV